jgi:hypothetical protein
MKARAAQEMPAHVEVAQMLARSAMAPEEAAQAAGAAGTATPSKTGRDVPAAKEEKLVVGGVSANVVVTATDEERRAARKATYLAGIADAKARRQARLTDMKQRLPSLAARLRRLWQDVRCTRKSASTKVHLRASAAVEEQLEKAEMLLQFTEKNLKPLEWHLMEAEVYLKSAREHLEVIETRMAPARAPPRSPAKAVVGFLRAGEPVKEHHGQGGRRGARAGPTAGGGDEPRGDERAVRQDQVPTRGPPRGMVWSLRKRAWCPPGELGGRRGRHRRRHERDAGGTAARKADKTVPRDVPVTLRTSREKQVAAERVEWPPPKAPGRWSGGETAGTDTGGWPEWVEARPSGGGGGIAALACGERGQDHDMDERQRRWRHSDGKAQQEDAARRPEVEASEPTDWKGHWLGGSEVARGELLHTTQEGHWLGETEAARGGLLHAAPRPGEQAGQPSTQWGVL